MNTEKSPARGPDPQIDQEQLLPFLLDPNSYPHHPRQVKMVQTHGSFVFLAPPLVFKVKKSVNFGFLNYSTLEKRRHFCEREVALNRRLCPKAYLGVVPISMRQGRFTFGVGDTVVEYAVKMRQLSQRSFLHERLQRGEVKPTDLDRIVGVLKPFYLSQQPTAEIEEWGRVDRLRISTDENFQQTESFIGQTLSRPAFETLRSYTDAFYTQHAKLFDSRVQQKWIRDCHGDLHLDHIHITPKTLQIYDCIEFNDRFRYVDVANDIAFLAMDFDFQGHPELARYFVTTMAAALHDDGMPRLMDFYKCYRAYVRGKVESLHSIAHAAPEAERTESAARARHYFQLALQYVVAGSQPLVVAVMGRIASGKSTLAKALATELGWKSLSSDRLRKEMAGLPLHERTRADARAQLYSAEMTEQTYEKLFTGAEAEMRAGRSVILDATFARRAHRDQLCKRLQRQGFTLRLLEAQADDASVLQRLQARESRADEVSDARREDFAALTQHYEPPTELPAGQCLAVSTTHPLTETVTTALQALSITQMNPPRPIA